MLNLQCALNTGVESLIAKEGRSLYAFLWQLLVASSSVNIMLEIEYSKDSFSSVQNEFNASRHLVQRFVSHDFFLRAVQIRAGLRSNTSKRSQ